MEKVRYRIKISGIVQGVGFRPFVYNLATKNSIYGYVFNSSDGVIIDVEGNKTKLENFIEEIKNGPPILAVINSIEINNNLELVNYTSFEIKESQESSSKLLPVSPDIAICKDCLKELFDISDRRYKYPFINCTNCGPRFTIIYKVPYDRKNTTMREFKMCSKCQKEYDEPANRRFHAQPNCCWECGPKLELWKSQGACKVTFTHDLISPSPPQKDKGKYKWNSSLKDPISTVINLLKEGYIVAIKGIGGFHLACNAHNDDAVNNLRKRKLRTFKPFAVMMKNIEVVTKNCFCNEEEKKLLLSSKAPIVLLKKKENSKISPLVAPFNNYLGVMLPYSPLHHILFKHSELDSLVMTSANFSEEPITIDNEEALTKISKIADYVLLYNRDINLRCDDSVVMDVEGPIIVRRSRGYAPEPLYLKISSPGILASGAELKNTFCLSKDKFYFLSQHIGDMENVEAYNFFSKSIEHFINFFNIKPAYIAHDMHPNYLSTKYANDHKEVVKKLIPVQHHHAHIASCMAENEIDEKVIGVAFDGTGYGSDGNIWGGEFFVCDYSKFERVGQFCYVPLPGGDIAVRNNYRMAISYLYQIYGNNLLEEFSKICDSPYNNSFSSFIKGSREGLNEVDLVCKQIKNKINIQLTSSCGRLFDAVSSILGIRHKVTYDAQAAIELEMIAEKSNNNTSYKICVKENDGIYIIDTIDIVKQILVDIGKGIKKEDLSLKFHNTIVEIIVKMCKLINKERKIKKVVLSGGVFQNRIILKKSINLLKNNNFDVFINRKVPPNDGGISLGQSVISATLCK